MHGARLVRDLLRSRPDLHVYGVGGDAMSDAGVSIVFHASRLAVVGIVEILGRLPEIAKALRWMKRSLTCDPPDLVILIDFPDFNLRVARYAARRGIPVVYYISPQIWAWRPGRIRLIARTVSRMLVIFPFEEPLYQAHGVPVTYVGHPLLDGLGETQAPGRGSESGASEELGLSPLYPVVGLFPGSRTSEVRNLLPTMIEGAEALHRRLPRVQFLLGQAPGLSEEPYTESLKGFSIPLQRVRSDVNRAMAICDLAVVASGTATLELALHGVPMIVVYRVSSATFLLGRLLVRVPSIGLVNLVSRRSVVPELLQRDFRAETLQELCWKILSNATYYFTIKRNLADVRALLGNPGASERAAAIVLEMLEGSNAEPLGSPSGMQEAFPPIQRR